MQMCSWVAGETGDGARMSMQWMWLPTGGVPLSGWWWVPIGGVEVLSWVWSRWGAQENMIRTPPALEVSPPGGG